MFDIRSDEFRRAVIKIQRRAERQELEEKLTSSFVPTRVIEELETDQNQLVFGRRGVGKTHTLKVYLGRKVQEGYLCSYIDCTSFGSGLGSEGSPKNVGARFFSKLVAALASNLLEHVVRLEYANKGMVDRLLNVTVALSDTATANPSGETFNYSEIIRLVNVFLVEIGSPRLYLIVDEWAQIPVTAQPYFAEYMKRSFFATNRVTVKIGVVDYTYQLSMQYDGNTIGLEKSADVFSDVRMDRHFVWNEDARLVENFFAELLYNHIGIELALNMSISPEEKVTLLTKEIFTQDRAFSELCRASEGNARDLLVIFGRAYADFSRQASRERVGLPDVQRAAIGWYREDKVGNIVAENGLEKFLEYVISDLISTKKARAFMVPSNCVHHPLLRRLFSARVLHPLNTEWSHPDIPGERYNLISVDYGTYASFKGTKNEPSEAVFWDLSIPSQDMPTDLVPLQNDRRSIRRIVIYQETLDKFWRMTEIGKNGAA